MALTVKDCINEFENWQYSAEAFEFKKECAELDLMMQYIENQQFALEAAAEEDTFTEGFLFECNEEAMFEAAIQATTKRESLFIKFFKWVGRAIMRFVNWIKTLFTKSEETTVNNALVAVSALSLATVLSSPATFHDSHEDQLMLPYNEISAEIQTVSKDVVDVTGPITTKETNDSIVITSAKAKEPVVVKKVWPKTVKSSKVVQALINCYNQSGFGQAGVSIDSKSNKSKAKKFLKLTNFEGSPWKNAKGSSYDMGTLLFCALTEFDIVLNVNNNTEVMNVDDVCAAYRLIIDTIQSGKMDFDSLNTMIRNSRNQIIKNGLTVSVDPKTMVANNEKMNNIQKALPAAQAKLEQMVKSQAAAIKEAAELFEERGRSAVHGSKDYINAWNRSQNAKQTNAKIDPTVKKANQAAQLANTDALPGNGAKNTGEKMNKCMSSLTAITGSVMRINSAVLKYRTSAGQVIKGYLAGKDASVEVSEYQAS